MSEKLVYVGKIIEIKPIPKADYIVSAVVVCGSGGKWMGIVKKDQFQINDLCVVYLPDSIIPESPDMQFMAASNWRVKMRRFKGAPSEVVIMPMPGWHMDVGTDCTLSLGVTKYHKPIPPNLNGKAVGEFPGFIPKTDEPNYQTSADLIEKLTGLPYYITVKMDGSSTTAFNYKGNFGLCSRNWQLEENPDNGFWKVANKYDLKNKLPEGFALQWETCGPGVQSNPAGLTELDGFAFSAYFIPEHRYLDMFEFMMLCNLLEFPMCEIIQENPHFNPVGLSLIGVGLYPNGKPREGVVVRSQMNVENGKPISFKVINLDYEK